MRQEFVSRIFSVWSKRDGHVIQRGLLLLIKAGVNERLYSRCIGQSRRVAARLSRQMPLVHGPRTIGLCAAKASQLLPSRCGVI